MTDLDNFFIDTNDNIFVDTGDNEWKLVPGLRTLLNPTTVDTSTVWTTVGDGGNMSDRNTFYIGTDGMFKRTVYNDGSAYDLSAVTKIGICFDGTVYDSDDYPTAFDWEAGDEGEIYFYLGRIDEIDEASIDPEAELILYDASAPNGFPVDVLYIEAKELE